MPLSHKLKQTGLVKTIRKVGHRCMKALTWGAFLRVDMPVLGALIAPKPAHSPLLTIFHTFSEAAMQLKLAAGLHNHAEVLKHDILQV